MRKTFFAILLLAAVIAGAWRLISGRNKALSPLERIQGASPVQSLKPAHITPAAPRSIASSEAPAIERRQQQEERFNDLKEEGRRIRQALIESDPRAAQAYQAVSQRPEYRQIIEQRHQIEAAWASAPDADRPAMLDQMNSLRQQGIAMILAEVSRVSAQPAAPQAGPGQTQATSGGAPAPVAPVVFQ